MVEDRLTDLEIKRRDILKRSRNRQREIRLRQRGDADGGGRIQSSGCHGHLIPLGATHDPAGGPDWCWPDMGLLDSDWNEDLGWAVGDRE